ncbi:MAG: hypothetical protein AB1646_11155 [Thermodesulfobacteriota bacterium]
MKRKADTREFRSFQEYLKAYYPKEEKKPIDDDISSFGERLAEKSMELMRELLSDRKVACKPQEGDLETSAQGCKERA